MNKKLFLLAGFLIAVNLVVAAFETHFVSDSVAAGLWNVRVRPDETITSGEPPRTTFERPRTRRLPALDPSARIQSSADTPAPFWLRMLAPEPAEPQQLRQLSIHPFGVHQPGITGLSLYVLSFVVLGLASAMVVLFIPERLRVLRETLSRGWRQDLRMGLTGFVVYFAALLFAFALTFLFVGIPFAIIALLAMTVFTLIGIVAVGLSVGYHLTRWTGENRPKALLQLLIGMLVVFPLSILPYAGWFLIAIMACIGLGAIIHTRFGTGAAWNLEALEW